jgi:hypothetical protein
MTSREAGSRVASSLCCSIASSLLVWARKSGFSKIRQHTSYQQNKHLPDYLAIHLRLAIAAHAHR